MVELPSIVLINEAPPIGGSKWFAHLPILWGEGEGVRGNQFPTFDAEFKFAKIQNI